MERILAIIVIIIGVSMFYFLVSSINTIISKTTKIHKDVNKKLLTLYQYMERYDVPFEIIKTVKRAVISGAGVEEALDTFPQKFKKKLQTDLEYYLYIPILREFNIFKFLRRDIVAAIGKSLQRAEFPPSRPHQTRPSTRRTTPARASTWCSRASSKCTTGAPTASPRASTPPAPSSGRSSC